MVRGILKAASNFADDGHNQLEARSIRFAVGTKSKPVGTESDREFLE